MSIGGYMMHFLTRENHLIYEFNKQNTPVLTVKSGETVTIETYDCFEDQITSEDTPISELDWDRINPATGPIFVEGAQPGDMLKVKIDKLEISSQGVMLTGPDLGVLGHRLEKMEAKILPIKDNHVQFDEVQIPLNKMIGVIGVAPAEGGVNCGTPGAHGGNMDNKMITEGATLYFPVFTEGALFALGDFHAAMGDGEVSVSGIEVAGKATVTLEVIKKANFSFPLLENEDVFSLIVSAKTLDEAAKLGTEMMADVISSQSGKSMSETVMLLSAAAQVEVCQIVDPLMTTRINVPKWLVEQLKISLI